MSYDLVEIRMKALDSALRVAPEGSHEETVVLIAKLFEDYLNGKTAQK